MLSLDEIRFWIINKLVERGRGSRKALADFLCLDANQITRMLNTNPGKEVRVIRADEWEKIKHFLAPELPVEKIDKPALLKRIRYIEIYDAAPPALKKELLKLAELLIARDKQP